MEHTTPLSHRPSIFTISASRMFERAGYYGLRAVLIGYIMGQTFGYSPEEAIRIYTIFTGVFVLTGIIGAVIGDFLLGSKTSSIIGIFVQAAGAFALSIASPIFLFLGLGLVLIGGGLYSPNMLAHFGKQYLDRKNLVDSGYMLFYVAISLGAFIGIPILLKLGENDNFGAAFIAAGVLFIIAGVLAILSADTKEVTNQNLNITVTKRTLNTIAAIVIVAGFWWLFELSSYQIRSVQGSLSSISGNPITNDLWQKFNPLLTIIGGIVLFFVWHNLKVNQYLKFGIGFLLTAIAFLAIYFFQDVQNMSSVILFGGSSLFLVAAELLIAPTVYASVAKYVNPKYMATVMAATFIPGFFLTTITGVFRDSMFQHTSALLLTALVLSSFVAAILLGLQSILKDDI